MLDDIPETGRTARTLEHGENGDVRALARELAEMRSALEADRSARREIAAASERRATWWRWAGGIAASIALTLASVATRLAFTASADHETVLRHDAVLAERDEREADLLEQGARTAATLDAVLAALAELRADVREIRAESRRQTGDRR